MVFFSTALALAACSSASLVGVANLKWEGLVSFEGAGSQGTEEVESVLEVDGSI